VLKLGDGPELALEIEHETVLEVAGGSHGGVRGAFRRELLQVCCRGAFACVVVAGVSDRLGPAGFTPTRRVLWKSA
jgi:hypothetical protein